MNLYAAHKNRQRMDSSAVFQQRLRDTHVRTASSRLEELEIKVLAAEKSKKQQARKQKKAKSPRGGLLRALLSTIAYPFGAVSSKLPRYDSYSKFGKADQLWEDSSSSSSESDGGPNQC